MSKAPYVSDDELWWIDNTFDRTVRKLIGVNDSHFDWWQAMDWMAAHWWLFTAAAILYVPVIFGLQAFFANRKPMGLRPLLIAYNWGLVAFNLIAVYYMMPFLLYALRGIGGDNLLCTTGGATAGGWMDNDVMFGHTSEKTKRALSEGCRWMLFFVVSKVPEMTDTLFLVFRKAPVITLHWYHHISVMLYCWMISFAMRYNGGGEGPFFACMNAIVHSVMYSVLRETLSRAPRTEFVAAFDSVDDTTATATAASTTGPVTARSPPSSPAPLAPLVGGLSAERPRVNSFSGAASALVRFAPLPSAVSPPRAGTTTAAAARTRLARASTVASIPSLAIDTDSSPSLLSAATAATAAVADRSGTEPATVTSAIARSRSLSLPPLIEPAPESSPLGAGDSLSSTLAMDPPAQASAEAAVAAATNDDATGAQVVAEKQPAATLYNAPGTAPDEFYSWWRSACTAHTLEELMEANDTLFVHQWVQQQLSRRDPPCSLAQLVRQQPPHSDKIVWATEHVRVLLVNFNMLAVWLHEDGCSCKEILPPPFPQALCGAHTKPQPCHAMLYFTHTLDWAATVMNDPRAFMSRSSLKAKEANSVLANVVRRLYRLVVHAGLCHSDCFERFELCQAYGWEASPTVFDLDDETGDIVFPVRQPQ